MACDTFDQLMDRLDLTDECECRVLIEHTASCPQCRKRFSETRCLCEALKRAFHFQPTARFWDGFHSAMQEVLESELSRPMDV